MILLMLACSGDAVPPESQPSDSASESRPDSEIEQLTGCSSDERVTVGTDTCVLEATCSWSGSVSRAYFGNNLATGQDVDGDGRDDVLIGAPGTMVYGDTEAFSAAGEAVLLSGASLDGDGALGANLLGGEVNQYMGSATAFVGDVDGDGVSDMLIGAMGSTVGALDDAGAAILVLGGPGETLTASATWTGGDAFGRAAWAMTGADIDGDGLSEVFITDGIKDEEDDYLEGRVHVWMGGMHSDAPLADADVVLSSGASRSGFGQAMASGDFDGDGVDEVAISSPYAASYTGQTWVVGQDLALSFSFLGEETYEIPGWKLAAGDLDGDGADELILGAPLNDTADDAAGQVRVYAGGASFFDEPTLAGSFNGERHDFQLGSGLATGDLDGDGDDELLMGSVNTYEGFVTKGGRIYVAGAEDLGVGVSAATLSRNVNGASVKDYIGASMGVGDLDGDGTGDLVIGAGYENLDGAYDVGAVHLFFGGI
ncbi:MAG: hypothetical protein GY913_12035 [Proteobacteria bacterium]|nr:hypothetical protein [Pseudomonadota bacterium]MCP4917645.1 hypothetical protein [Pseudomonadota bacterium]